MHCSASTPKKIVYSTWHIPSQQCYAPNVGISDWSVDATCQLSSHLAVAKSFSPIFGIWLKQDLDLCFLIVLKPAKGVIRLDLPGYRCFIYELGWSQLCVFCRLFDVFLLPPPTSRYIPSIHAPSLLNFCITGSRSFRQGGLMCAADLICKPVSIHYVKLVSLRKEGRGQMAPRASFNCRVSSGGYCCVFWGVLGGIAWMGVTPSTQAERVGGGAVERALHHLAQLWDAWLLALGW